MVSASIASRTRTSRMSGSRAKANSSQSNKIGARTNLHQLAQGRRLAVRVNWECDPNSSQAIAIISASRVSGASCGGACGAERVEDRPHLHMRPLATAHRPHVALVEFR